MVCFMSNSICWLLMWCSLMIGFCVVYTRRTRICKRLRQTFGPRNAAMGHHLLHLPTWKKCWNRFRRSMTSASLFRMWTRSKQCNSRTRNTGFKTWDPDFFLIGLPRRILIRFPNSGQVAKPKGWWIMSLMTYLSLPCRSATWSSWQRHLRRRKFKAVWEPNGPTERDILSRTRMPEIRPAPTNRLDSGSWISKSGSGDGLEDPNG